MQPGAGTNAAVGGADCLETQAGARAHLQELVNDRWGG